MQAFKQRWISGDLPEYYKESDPAVKYGDAQAGQKVDYSTLFQMGPAALWLMPKGATVGSPALPISRRFSRLPRRTSSSLPVRPALRCRFFLLMLQAVPRVRS